MLRRLLVGLTLAVASATVEERSASNTSTVYIIRHGEKTWALGCLNAQGQARANSLPSTFSGAPSATHATFLKPDKLFANHYDDPIDCERCKQTLQAISTALGQAIIFSYGHPSWEGGNSLAASAIRNASMTVSTVLVAWEHVNIQYLAADLGVPKAKIPTWPGSDFDTVYVLSM